MGQDDKSQAEDMDVRLKRHSIEHGDGGVDLEGNHIALCQTAGHRSVISSVDLDEVSARHECETMTGVSTQEEADTRMIHHAVEVASNGMNVHIYPQDTDVLFLALRRTPLLGDRSAAIIGTSEIRHKVFLQPRVLNI